MKGEDEAGDDDPSLVDDEGIIEDVISPVYSLQFVGFSGAARVD